MMKLKNPHPIRAALAAIALLATAPLARSTLPDVPATNSEPRAIIPSSRSVRSEPLEARVDDYVRSLIDGRRSAMIEPDDFYPELYIISKYKIEGIRRVSGSSYQVRLRFITKARIAQSLRSRPRIRRIPVKSEFAFSLDFKLEKGYLLWTRRLQTPFVRQGHEGRYVLPE